MWPNRIVSCSLGLWLFFVSFSGTTSLVNPDPNGYILYCPCMGRFGNQAEQFLGTLQFAKYLNRTLILPPFIEYINYKINFVPFNHYIAIDELKKYHRAITVDQFMSNLASNIWQESSRTIACYTSRNFKTGNSIDNEGCNPFEGSPFREFWHHIGIKDFPAGSLYYSPIHTDYNFASDWIERFGEVKVLSFVGAPSSFPTNSKAVLLQKYVYFSQNVIDKGIQFRDQRGFARKPYIAVHLRHGTDWAKACDLIKSNSDLTQLFSSQQCLGENKSKTPISYNLCMPSFDEIVDSIQKALNAYNWQHQNDPIKHIYIATDYNNESLWMQLHQTLSSELTFITPTTTINSDGSSQKHKQPHFMTDIYLMSYANLFIGNCISSFSAFVSRYRFYNLHFVETTHFFAYDKTIFENQHLHVRDEL